ncbi:MAG: class I SAM-dependent rRNA methyltransferase [Christensenellaceae bacterium]|nr:class I SAM-dependent rRNA methyltransferase [Christensenellaceae bacterium]
MAKDRGYPVFTVTPKAERALKNGHPWVYGAEVTHKEGAYSNGGLADIVNRKGSYLGTALVNDQSKIMGRILSRNTNDRFDEAFFRRRIQYALDYRQTVMQGDFAACRLLFGEADQLPGLTVDRFDDILVAQTLCLGLDQRKGLIFRLLAEELRARGQAVRALYERNDVAIRALEGMEQYKAFFELEGLETNLSGRVEISENGVLYGVDYINGQKTGFFLDQKYNRQAVARLAPGKRVLDCFTHTGAFALNAAKAGAAHVCAVDVSAAAIDMCRANAARNGVENISYLVADVFDLLTEMANEKSCPYDFIILDPPAFTKSSATAANAYRGYKEINLKAMRLLPRGGYLATCSCSHFMREDMFRQMLREAAFDAGRTLRQIEARQQAPDHPILPAVPETDYLKFYLLQVI